MQGGLKAAEIDDLGQMFYKIIPKALDTNNEHEMHDHCDLLIERMAKHHSMWASLAPKWRSLETPKYDALFQWLKERVEARAKNKLFLKPPDSEQTFSEKLSTVSKRTRK